MRIQFSLRAVVTLVAVVAIGLGAFRHDAPLTFVAVAVFYGAVVGFSTAKHCGRVAILLWTTTGGLIAGCIAGGTFGVKEVLWEFSPSESYFTRQIAARLIAGSIFGAIAGGMLGALFAIASTNLKSPDGTRSGEVNQVPSAGQGADDELRRLNTPRDA